MSEQDNESAEKTRKLHLTQEAKRLLGEPLISGFFERQRVVCFEAFRQLPMGAKIEEYQTVHHALLAVESLESTLQAYIQEYDMIMLQEKREENVAEGI